MPAQTRRLEAIMEPQREKFGNYVHARVNYVMTKILVDTGASRSCISESLFQKLRKTVKCCHPLSSDEPTHLISASGSELKVIGTVDADVNFKT